MFGFFLVICAAAFGGKLALGAVERRVAKPFQLGWTVSSIGAVIGATIDSLSQIWVAFGVIPSTSSFAGYVSIAGVFAVYLCVGTYVLAVVYFRRLVPFTWGTRSTRGRL